MDPRCLSEEVLQSEKRRRRVLFGASGLLFLHPGSGAEAPEEARYGNVYRLDNAGFLHILLRCIVRLFCLEDYCNVELHIFSLTFTETWK